LKADPDDRIPACTRLLDSGRKDFDVGTIYSTRANVWYLKGNFDNAVVDYQAAINHNPKLSAALQGLGNSYFRKSEFRLAIKAYSDALAVEKKSAELYNNRGLAQLNVGEFSSAVRDFGEAIKINPKFSSAYNNRGIAYSRYKQFEPAIKDFTKAIEIDPKFVDAYMGRAEVLIVEKSDLDGGLRDYDKVRAARSCASRAILIRPWPTTKKPCASIRIQNPSGTAHSRGRPKAISTGQLRIMMMRSCSTPTMPRPMRPGERYSG
jgi:Flp pilus assembly protein TadD